MSRWLYTCKIVLPSMIVWMLAFAVIVLLMLSVVPAFCHGEPSTPLDRLAIAKAEAIRLEKPLVVSVGATWCTPCKEVESIHATVIREDAVYVHLDFDADATIIATLPRVREIPTVFVWDLPLLRLGVRAVPKVIAGIVKIRLFVHDMHEWHKSHPPGRPPHGPPPHGEHHDQHHGEHHAPHR